MIDCGLNQSQLELIRHILGECPETIDSVALFGSRATNTHEKYSDIDLTLYGDLSQAAVDRLWTLFHESSLPCKVDLIAYQHVRYAPMKQRIDETAKILFTGDEIRGRTKK